MCYVEIWNLRKVLKNRRLWDKTSTKNATQSKTPNFLWNLGYNDVGENFMQHNLCGWLYGGDSFKILTKLWWQKILKIAKSGKSKQQMQNPEYAKVDKHNKSNEISRNIPDMQKLVKIPNMLEISKIREMLKFAKTLALA